MDVCQGTIFISPAPLPPSLSSPPISLHSPHVWRDPNRCSRQVDADSGRVRPWRGLNYCLLAVCVKQVLCSWAKSLHLFHGRSVVVTEVIMISSVSGCRRRIGGERPYSCRPKERFRSVRCWQTLRSTIHAPELVQPVVSFMLESCTKL